MTENDKTASKTIIVWYRTDIRIHDHPALTTAANDAEYVVPTYVLNDDYLTGEYASSNRNRFLIESLQDLKTSFQKLNGDLVICHGDAYTELLKLARQSGATAIYYTADFTPYIVKQDKQLKAQLAKQNIQFRAFPGRLTVSSLDKLQTKAKTTHKIFTPFWKNWQQVQRRPVAKVPKLISLPSSVKVGKLPILSTLTNDKDLSPNALPGGETEARKRLKKWLNSGIKSYHQTNNDMANDGTSRISSYLHFGCLSTREIETMLPHNAGSDAWHRQLAWREFYHYIIFKFPNNAGEEFQERYRNLKWSNDNELFRAWQDGRTGYPVVDAAMRQLQQEGWMHNRARLIVGSFLTKDLWLDWRLGEAHFMQLLTDGDQANNNGNWQWIASVGVDPAPVFRRLYNPTSQQANYDPTGAYVHRYVPELKDVPDKYLAEPWTMPEDLQKQSNCIIGTDYPAPVVDHKQARLAALEHYRSAAPLKN